MQRSLIIHPRKETIITITKQKNIYIYIFVFSNTAVNFFYLNTLLLTFETHRISLKRFVNRIVFFCVHVKIIITSAQPIIYPVSEAMFVSLRKKKMKIESPSNSLILSTNILNHKNATTLKKAESCNKREPINRKITFIGLAVQ